MFGEGDSATFKIAYAPSAGYRIKNEPNWIDDLLNGFSGIGVRDENTANLVKEYSKLRPKLVIDPCLHLLSSKYASWFTNQKRREFVTVYSPLLHRFVNAFHQNLGFGTLPNFVQNYKHLGYFPRKRFLQDLSKQFTDPLWTVQQIARSNLLITSTFHGVMMALMTKTPFIAVTSPNLSARLQSPIAETFSDKRLMTMDEINNLSNEGLKAFLADDDIDQIMPKEYISSSDVWMKKALSKLSDQY